MSARGWIRRQLDRPIAGREGRTATVCGLLLLLAAAGLVLTRPSPLHCRRRQRSGPHPGVHASGRVAQRWTPAIAAATRSTAETFLAGYLAYLYGQAPASAVKDATEAFVDALEHEPLRVPPGIRALHPRIVSVIVSPQAPGRAIAAAVVSDGEVVHYPIGLILTQTREALARQRTAGQAMNEQRSHSRALWMWLLAGSASTGDRAAPVVGVAVAVLGASLGGCQPGSTESTEVDLRSNALGLCAADASRPNGCACTRVLESDLTSTGRSSRSIAEQECSSGDCAGTNEAGCAGPMQIAYVRESECSRGSGPTLWERFAVNADPGQPLSVNNPADAIYTAARILREDMGAPPTGGTFAEYHEAACHYYGACC